MRHHAFRLACACLALGQPHAGFAQHPYQAPAAAQAPRPGPAFGEPGGVLGLHAALDLALSRNPDLAVLRREIDALEGAQIQSGTRPNPQVGYLLEDTRRETSTTTWQFSQPIELGGKREARVAAAERQRALAVADLAARRSEVRALTIGSFHELLTAQERQRLAADSVDLARRATDVTARRVAAGRVSPVEETRARVAESGVQLEYLQAGNELGAARRRLASLWGGRSPAFERADGRIDALPAVPAVADIEHRLDASPHLDRAGLEIERRKALTAVERSRRVPDLTLVVGAKRPEDLGRSQWILGVAIPIPVFDDNRGNILEAAQREGKARDEYQALRARLAAEALLARDRLASAHRELGILRDTVLPGAKSAYDAATTGFELGKFQFLDVLDAQRTLFQAQSQVLRTLSEVYRSAAEIERVLGEDRLHEGGSR